VAGILRSSDVAAVREQLGREPTIPFEVVARCTGGHPLVIRNAPLDARGRPFPTAFWLTCPAAVKAVARIESEGEIARLNERYEADAGFAAAVDAAHDAYAETRARGLPEARGWGGVGGTARGVKCLHAHYAWWIAGGDDAVGSAVAERIGRVHPEQPPGRVAAIDQGTNSIRLLVLEPGEGEPVELARDMVITRLGRGVDETARLDPDAVERTLEAMDRFVRRARALGVDRLRVGATSAVRDASNRDAFLQGVRRVAGVAPEILDGRREAELSFLGGTRGLDPADGPFLVVDIGGGSTEFVLGGEPGRAGASISTQMGSVRMTERFVRADPPADGELRAVAVAVDEILDDVEAHVRVRDASTMVAVAGTATTTQACALGLDVYDPDLIHRSWLTLDAAVATLRRFASMTNAERAAIPVMPPGRGDVITAGAAILVGVMRRFGFDRALVSETDILDGLALELMDVG
jgi:exopolyphosphatase/guanosine-5'-triphosphate,3'-diphosphate pyrophosphatase